MREGRVFLFAPASEPAQATVASRPFGLGQVAPAYEQGDEMTKGSVVRRLGFGLCLGCALLLLLASLAGFFGGMGRRLDFWSGFRLQYLALAMAGTGGSLAVGL